MGLWQFISWHYISWSSRTPIEAAIFLLINKIKLWTILNSIVIAGLATSIVFLCRPGSIRNALIALSVFALGALLMPFGAITEGAYWMTGSFNYLWPVAFSALFFVFLIKSVNEGKSYALPASFFIFLSSFSEQVAVINLLLLIVLAFNLKKEQRSLLIIPAFCLILVLIYIATCPGNSLRYTQELNNWFSDYANFGLVGKIMLGFNIVYSQYFHYSLTAILLTLSIALRCNNAVLKLALYVLSIIILIISLESKHEFISNEFLSSILRAERLSSTSYLSIGSLLRTVILNAFIIISAIGLFMTDGPQKQRINAVLFYVISFAPTMVLMLSPTIYASNERIFFVSCIMQSTLAAYLVMGKMKK